MPEHDIARHLSAGQAHLRGIDSAWARLVDQVGDCRLTTAVERSPYESLARSVAYQQLHGKAAAAIVGRLVARFPGQDFPSPQQLAALAPETLRECGFSARKVATLQGLASAAMEGDIPGREEAAEMDDEDLVKRFTRIKGIGRWTVEMMLIGTLGRPDILPVDDFGIRDGTRYLFGLDHMPTPAETRRRCEPCRPWRTLASWYLWRANEQPDYRRLGQ
ncbi:DNA-3-methyladenine glycosylase [Halomonas denitrificans]|uniref:DNA-3-methyladenine glycosylase family protein n=1 Tax=Halomonas TaxID=2745 RepID=UPI001C94387F|nr:MULTISPECIES: DNA-3-methyladenine glycosylase [Halomonas]MBY5969479.1 DNA-3-methyladenine glycosylase [Halomonas denitrificans]MBY6030793.1 DNA-3-methyladenine glycosylase [Halomonas sp. DP8Y7-1]MCA0976382.1 DNA-3-methyladenine glycosylase [Halomonas denitrificans]